jgi:hypothetical protein
MQDFYDERFFYQRRKKLRIIKTEKINLTRIYTLNPPHSMQEFNSEPINRQLKFPNCIMAKDANITNLNIFISIMTLSSFISV